MGTLYRRSRCTCRDIEAGDIQLGALQQRGYLRNLGDKQGTYCCYGSLGCLQEEVGKPYYRVLIKWTHNRLDMILAAFCFRVAVFLAVEALDDFPDAPFVDSEGDRDDEFTWVVGGEFVEGLLAWFHGLFSELVCQPIQEELGNDLGEYFFGE